MALCTAPEQKSIRLGVCRSLATWRAVEISSETPSFLLAEMGTTGTPNSSARAFSLMVPPLARTSSIMFRAMTMGMFSSMSCILR